MAGTIFQKTRMSLTLWFRAVWWVTAQENGASALGLQRILGLGQYKTALTWLHKLRRAMVRPGRDRLDELVEVDEIYVGGKASGALGRKLDKKALVAVAAEETGAGVGRVRLKRTRRFGRQPGNVHPRGGRARQHRAHGWLAQLFQAAGPRLPPRSFGEGRGPGQDRF